MTRIDANDLRAMISCLRRAHAFSLVELTLALGVAAFCLLAVFGLMPIGVQTNRNATSQTAAANIIAAVVADLRSTSKVYSDSKTYGAGDQVFYGGYCYVATFTTVGNRPPNSRFWSPGFQCPRFGISFPTSFPATNTLYFDDAGRSPPVGDPRYRLDVTFLTWSNVNLYGAELKVTWPASADPTAPSGSSETFAAFDRN